LASKFYGSDYGALDKWVKATDSGTQTKSAAPAITAGLEDYAGGAAAQNLGAAGKNQELAALINTVNQAAQQKLNDAQLGATGVAARDQQLQNILRSSQGNLGEDYVRQQQNRYAGEAGNSGMGVDSSNWNAALERTLGLETKKIQDNAVTQLGDWTKNNPAAKLYGMESGNIGAADYATAVNRSKEQGQNLALDYAKLAEQKRAAIEAARLADIGHQIKNREIVSTWNPGQDPYSTKSKWGNTPNGLYQTTRLNSVV
jgi:hypothetical protein